MSRTVPQACRQVAARLEGATPSGAAEARILVAHVLGASPAQLYTAQVTDEELARVLQLADRRRAGEPVQHLTGRAWFRHVEVAVGPGVFIPRPETEVVAQAAIDHARARIAATGQARVVELCAGSGAISAALVDEVPGAEVTAVEVDDAAVDWCRRNLAHRGVRVIHADLADALPGVCHEVDVVVANPPYVPTAAAEALPDDVRGYDPHRALFAGPDGLDVIRAIEPVAARLLVAGGLLVCEHDDSHRITAPAVFAGTDWQQVSSHDDLTGRPRFLTAVAGGRMRT